jgi:hypothetical protein
MAMVGANPRAVKLLLEKGRYYEHRAQRHDNADEAVLGG